MKKKLIIVGIIVLVVFNLHPLRTIMEVFIDEDHYRYTNYSGSFTVSEKPFKVDRRYPQVIKGFHAFKDDKKPNSKDTILYRLFWRNPLAFWRWRGYFTEERYKLPYMDFDEVKKRRGKNWVGDNYYQRF